MKLALISAGLFLASYIAVNRGLGPQPLQLILPLVVAVGSVMVAQWFMRRRAKPDREKTPFEDLAERVQNPHSKIPHPPHIHVPHAANPPRPPGNKARKLF